MMKCRKTRRGLKPKPGTLQSLGVRGEVLARTLTSWDEREKERVAILHSKCFKKAYTIPLRKTGQECEHRLHYRSEWKGGNDG